MPPCWPGAGFAGAEGLPPIGRRDAGRGFAPGAGIGWFCRSSSNRRCNAVAARGAAGGGHPAIRPPTVNELLALGADLEIKVAAYRAAAARKAQAKAAGS